MKRDLLLSGRRRLWPGALAAAMLGAGCASAPLPEAQLAVSRGAIDDALAAGAPEAAPLELQSARDKLARANAAVAAEKNEEARRLAEQAEVDARLAAARTRTERANLAALEIRKSIRALRDNLDDTQGVPPPAPGRMP